MRYAWAYLLFLGTFCGGWLVPARAENGPPWYQAIHDFYGQGAPLVLSLAKERACSSIGLLPMRNDSSYLVSMPSNWGLAQALERADTPQRFKVFFQQAPVRPVWRAQPSHDILPESGQVFWVRLHLDHVLIDKEQGTATLTLGLEWVEGSHTTSIFRRDLLSGTYQLRRFVDKKPWGGAGFYGLVIGMVVLLASCWLVIFSRREILAPLWRSAWWQRRFPARQGQFSFYNPRLEVLLLCGLAGLGTLLLNAVPFGRQDARVYEPIELLFMVDNNSELFFPKQDGQIGPPEIIRGICEAILDLDRFQIHSPNPNHRWLLWLQQRMPSLILGRPSFELNAKAGYRVHLVSGAAHTSPLYPLTSPLEAKRDLAQVIRSDGILREARLILPAEEIRWLGHNSEYQLKGLKTVVLFTGACTSSPQDLSRYERLAAQNDVGKVFSVFLPTVPRVGAFNGGWCDFEEGKLNQLRKVSDFVVSLNQNRWDKQTLSVPFFKHSNLSSRYAWQWDVPRDLNPIRMTYLTLENPKSQDAYSDRVARLFDRFLDAHVVEKPDANQLAIQVLVKDSHWLIAYAIFVLAISWLLFSYYRYSDAWLFRWTRSKGFRLLETLPVSISGIVICGLFLWLLRAGDDWRYASALGHSQVVFAATACFWLTLFVLPHQQFLVCWRGEGSGTVLRPWAGYSFNLFTVAGLTICGLVAVRIASSPLAKALCLLGMAFVMPLLWLVLASALKHFLGRFPHPFLEMGSLPMRGFIPLWHHPLAALIIKLLLWLALVLPLGAWVAVDPSASIAYPLNCFYQSLVYGAAFLWMVLGVAALQVGPITRLFHTGAK